MTVVNSLIKQTKQRQDQEHGLQFLSFGLLTFGAVLCGTGCLAASWSPPAKPGAPLLPSVVTTKRVSRHCQMSQNCPWLGTTAVDHVSRGESLEIHPDFDKSISKIKSKVSPQAF